MYTQPIKLASISIANNLPLSVIGGINVLENFDIAVSIANSFQTACANYALPYVFKASFDKANRSSIHSYRGIGIDAGLQLLERIRKEIDAPILTDVHEVDQAKPVAEVADILQIPAFLSRQTDLVIAMAQTGKVINIKKAQYLSPHEMQHIVEKCKQAGNQHVMVCERGTCFGYNNLIVDMLGIDTLRNSFTTIFDVTHALQIPGGKADTAGGRSKQTFALARSAVAIGIAGIFIESHPDPANAKCDGPSALAQQDIPALIHQLAQIDTVVKQL